MNLIDPEKTLILLNKIDLVQKIRKEDILAKIGNISIIETSMHNQMGISEIEEKIVNLVYCGKVSQSNNLIVTNVRHKNILERSRNSIKDAINMVNMQEALEFIEIDVNSTYEALGEIIGETVQDDIINEVFARFCLGK